MEFSWINFLKMHGLGNDFIMIHDSKNELTIHPVLAKKLCDRRLGIGADQLLRLKPSKNADVSMDIFNADGSTAEMCGNGIRAVGYYLKHYGPQPDRREYQIETLAGVKKVFIQADDQVSVDMGVPELRKGETLPLLTLTKNTVQFLEVNLGNPHAVIFVPEVDLVPLQELGSQIENHPRFPQKTNVEFVQVLDRGTLKVRVWERGAGATLACGTGACAAVVAALATGKISNEASQIKVHLPGGVLQISWNGEQTSIIMTGPVQEVFQGRVNKTRLV